MSWRKRSSGRLEQSLVGEMAGEYKILRRIGSGGFGTVYEAEHPLLKRKAAVKVLHADRGVDSPAVLRFFAEAQAASQIRHRHVVDIFSFGKLPNGQHFYVMDLFEGAPLDQYLKALTRLEPVVVVSVLRPIAEALDALHGHGIVHRDVKPPNIYLAWESNDEVTPKLLDFGLVKMLADAPLHTASGVPMGTPYYMSPEQCRGEKVDARSDVYAFGVICYELLTGVTPFGGDTPAAVLVAHLVKEVPRISAEFPALPATLDEPIRHMLAKDPAGRPSSVGAALVELEEALRASGLEPVRGPLHLQRVSLPPLPEPPVSRSLSDFGTGSPSALRPSEPGSWLWLGGAVLVVVAAASLYSLSGERASGSAPVAGNASSPTSATTPPAAAPDLVAVPMPLTAAPAAPPAPSIAASASARPSSSAPPSARAPGTAAPRARPGAAKRAVPTDLENPF
jgi:serine/threonine protein kinase